MGLGQLLDLGLALALAAAVGLDQEIRGKDAGLRTNTLVGLASAVFVELSKYGFANVPNAHQADPSRVAAQIVSGIGFIGAGIIFVQRGNVHGLTTAAAVWLTAAVGAAAGAGLLLLATVATAGYLFTILALTPVVRAIEHARADGALDRLRNKPRGMSSP